MPAIKYLKQFNAEFLILITISELKMMSNLAALLSRGTVLTEWNDRLLLYFKLNDAQHFYYIKKI